eukprot:551086_1
MPRHRKKKQKRNNHRNNLKVLKRNPHHNKQTQKKQTRNSHHNTRIDHLLDIHRHFIANNGKHENYDDIYLFVCEYYSSLKGDSFMSDYLKYVELIDTNNLYEQNHGTCNVKTCGHIQRQYRDRSIYDGDSIRRRKLYFDAPSEESIVIYQMLDGLQVIKFHLIGMGLRCRFTAAGTANQMVKDMANKRDTFSKIRKDISMANDKSIGYANKFVTQMVNEVDDEDDNKNEFAQYGFGIRFYYHPYYRHNESTREQIPGAPDGCIDGGNSNRWLLAHLYTFSDWFVAPIYKSMKDEVLNNQNHPITMDELQSIFKKSNNEMERNEASHEGIMARVGSYLQHQAKFAYHIKSCFGCYVLYKSHQSQCSVFKKFQKINKNRKR